MAPEEHLRLSSGLHTQAHTWRQRHRDLRAGMKTRRGTQIAQNFQGRGGGYTEVHDSEDRAHAHTTALQCLVPRSCSCLDVLTLISVLDHKFLEKKDSILFT